MYGSHFVDAKGDGAVLAEVSIPELPHMVGTWSEINLSSFLRLRLLCQSIVKRGRANELYLSIRASPALYLPSKEFSKILYFLLFFQTDSN
ncbi:MAG: hypothetical protein D3909_11610 [Candidatus Electrothrix sp. ATG1]|nr:hypothetical protein [Candidatus Electrothrix sp. ATG1]